MEVQMFFRLLIIAVACALLWQSVRIWNLGRTLTRMQFSMRNYQYNFVVVKHVQAIKRAISLGMLAIVLVYVLGWTSPRSASVPWWLFYVHVALVVTLAFVVPMILYKYDGLRWPTWHQTITRIVYVLFGVLMVSGMAQYILLF
jgi:hypothetical protein